MQGYGYQTGNFRHHLTCVVMDKLHICISQALSGLIKNFYLSTKLSRLIFQYLDVTLVPVPVWCQGRLRDISTTPNTAYFTL